MSKSIKQKNYINKIGFLLASWRSMTKIAGSASGSEFGSISQRHGSADPDPNKNVMDPEHWKRNYFCKYVFRRLSLLLCQGLVCSDTLLIHIPFTHTVDEIELRRFISRLAAPMRVLRQSWVQIPAFCDTVESEGSWLTMNVIDDALLTIE